MTEKFLQQKILQFCKKRDILAVKVDCASTTGWPDLTVIVPGGRVLFVELKTGKNKQSPAQQWVEAEIKGKGAEYHVIRTVAAFEQIINAPPTGGDYPPL